MSGNQVFQDRHVLDELIGYIQNETTEVAPSELRIPVSHFTDPDRAEAEFALLKRLPVIAAHISELAEPGAFITREVLGMPLLIVHQGNGVVSSYLNICRHRGGRVEQAEAGRKRFFMCSYHGWSYDREGGGLQAVPYEDSFGPIDYACRGLHRIKTDVYHGLIFVDFSNDETRSIERWISPDADRQIAPWDLERSVIYLDRTFTLPVNWKLVIDGAVDSLHPPFLHRTPGGVGSRVVRNVATFKTYGRHGKLFAPRSKLLKLVQEGADIEANSKYLASIMLLYPNALLAGAPDHVEFWTVWPTRHDPGSCTVRIRFLVRPEILTPEMEERLNKSWEILEFAATKEDWPMEVWIQQNSKALPDNEYIYGRNEVAAQHLHHQLQKEFGP